MPRVQRRNKRRGQHISVIVLSIIAIIRICVGRARLARFTATRSGRVRESSQESSTVTTATRMTTRTSAMPVTVCSDERPGLALLRRGIPVGGGGGRGGGGPLTRGRGAINIYISISISISIYIYVDIYIYMIPVLGSPTPPPQWYPPPPHRD